jgi:hydroxyacylglutathione hydrolase
VLLKRFYDDPLAQASYLIGCQRTGEAVVVDPNRDVEQYLRAAGSEGLRVTHVTETHIHADYVSGARELASRASAALLLSDAGDAAWKYEYARDAGARLLDDGDRVMVGDVELRVLHTPGHTPEHLSFLVTDTVATREPMGVLTGDFVFVGDVGRPDLLERAAKVAGTMEAGARTLFRTLQAFKRLPDHLQIWPGHGAGSACGKALGAVPTTTVGYERIANWAFAIADEERFVEEVLAGLPDPPAYFARMKEVNKRGPTPLGGFRRPERLDDGALDRVAADRGALIIDIRPAPDFAAGHLAGTLNIPVGRSFTAWAGALVPSDQELYLVAGDRAESAVDDAARGMAMIGLDRVSGWFGGDALAAVERRRPLTQVVQRGPSAVAGALARGEVTVIDVRAPAEWEAGHLPGVANLPLASLPGRLDELPRDRPLVVQCQAGSRSSIAASLLRARGFADVANLAGGYAAWERAGLPVERPE